MLTGQSHSGWKAIAARLGVRDVRTAKRWVKQSHIPVFRMGKFVVLDESIYRVWMSSLLEIHKEKNERQKVKAISEGGSR
jgi:hypothetical protein